MRHSNAHEYCLACGFVSSHFHSNGLEMQEYTCLMSWSNASCLHAHVQGQSLDATKGISPTEGLTGLKQKGQSEAGGIKLAGAAAAAGSAQGSSIPKQREAVLKQQVGTPAEDDLKVCVEWRDHSESFVQPNQSYASNSLPHAITSCVRIYLRVQLNCQMNICPFSLFLPTFG